MCDRRRQTQPRRDMWSASRDRGWPRTWASRGCSWTSPCPSYSKSTGVILLRKPHGVISAPNHLGFVSNSSLRRWDFAEEWDSNSAVVRREREMPYLRGGPCCVHNLSWSLSLSPVSLWCHVIWFVTSCSLGTAIGNSLALSLITKTKGTLVQWIVLCWLNPVDVTWKRKCKHPFKIFCFISRVIKFNYTFKPWFLPSLGHYMSLKYILLHLLSFLVTFRSPWHLQVNLSVVLGAVSPPDVSYPRAIKACCPILYDIDNFLNDDIFSTYT